MSLPSQFQIEVPLLRVFESEGGRAPISTLYDGAAAEISLTEEARSLTKPHPGRPASTSMINAFEHTTCGAAQRLKLLGLVHPALSGSSIRDAALLSRGIGG
ncbi:hypothetical protein ACFQX4_17790 [Roseomonas sp. GCM10028921]